MLLVRRAEERGYFDHGWLKTHHSFSFGEYRDLDYMGFRALRVINEDWIEPGVGFPKHAHQNMEILTYVLEGVLEHQDSLGNTSVIQKGEFQRMTAGTGVRHSEENPSQNEATHLYQIWILPDQDSLNPSYEQKSFESEGVPLMLVASPTGEKGSIKIHQDVKIYKSFLEKDEAIEYSINETRGIWLQVVQGTIDVGGNVLEAGDGLSVEDASNLTIKNSLDGEFLLFDLGLFKGEANESST